MAAADGWSRDDEAFEDVFAPAPAADDIGCGRLATGAPDVGIGLDATSANDMTALGEENNKHGEKPSEKIQRTSSVNRKARAHASISLSLSLSLSLPLACVKSPA